MEKILVFSDAAWSIEREEVYVACVIIDAEGELIFTHKYDLLAKSSCEAEYMGLIFAIEKCLDRAARKVILYSDNQTLVGHMNGGRVNTASLKPYNKAAKDTIRDKSCFDEAKVSYIEGSKNPADKPCRDMKKFYSKEPPKPKPMPPLEELA